MTAGRAGKFLSESRPWPWMGAEKVDGKPVGFAEVLVGTFVKVVTRTAVDAAVIEVDLPEMTVEAAVDQLTLTPKIAPIAAVEAGCILFFEVELNFPEVTGRSSRGSVRGAVIARPERVETRARTFML
jgi:hypothetical protein